jgi:hypothetical protein
LRSLIICPNEARSNLIWPYYAFLITIC